MTNEREESADPLSQPRTLLRYYSSSSRLLLWRGLSAEEEGEGEGVEEEEEEEEDGQRRAS